jgi:hypothetical protein
MGCGNQWGYQVAISNLGVISPPGIQGTVYVGDGQNAFDPAKAAGTWTMSYTPDDDLTVMVDMGSGTSITKIHFGFHCGDEYVCSPGQLDNDGRGWQETGLATESYTKVLADFDGIPTCSSGPVYFGLHVDVVGTCSNVQNPQRKFRF